MTRPFDWQRDLHPSQTWIRGTVLRESPFSPWWTPRRIGIVTVSYFFVVALLVGYALGVR